MAPLLSCRRLGYSYHSRDGETQALADVSFSVNAGEFVVVVGPSGCGKSTLLSLICGLLSPEQGEIVFYENDENQKVSGGKSVPRIGYMLQQDHLLEWRSVYRNAMLGLELRGESDDESRGRVSGMLERYHLMEFMDCMPSELSGGMRQRVALIRTLAPQPELLLLDEPFSALDYQTRLEVADDIGRIIREERKTALMVTHDLGEAISLADRVLVLTGRPATVRAQLPICFGEELLHRPASALERRNAPEFPGYFQKLWREVRGDE